jgi:hypothetical protein
MRPEDPVCAYLKGNEHLDDLVGGRAGGLPANVQESPASSAFQLDLLHARQSENKCLRLAVVIALLLRLVWEPHQ